MLFKDMLANRKLRKLLRDPKLFFKDMYAKKRISLKKYLPIRHTGHNSFTIVSAAYNVSKYLDDYFKSITKQSLIFKEHIHIICVDDGSTDNTAEIIKSWQNKYPNNITYLYKENGGQASARNLGLEHVQTSWVTFIDPDDFVDVDYFYVVDRYLESNKKIDYSMLSCTYIFYYEDKNSYSDTHPLNYKYAKGNKTIQLKNMADNVQMAVHSVFFKHNYIKENNIKFNELIKPSFEDGKFVSDYLLNQDQYINIAFLKEAKYYYRKRSDETSTLDTAWQQASRFTIVPKLGYLQILKDYNNQGRDVPDFIKNTLLYELSWHIKYLINQPNRTKFLIKSEKEEYLYYLDQIFSYIDKEFIFSFNARFLWFYYKVGILGCFKNETPPMQIAYIEKIDKAKRQICLRYFSYFKNNDLVKIDGVEINSEYSKAIKHKFIDRVFTYEFIYWLSIPKEAKELEFFINNEKVRLNYNGQQHQILNLDFIQKEFNNRSTIKLNNWLLMDRDTQADDNAEHLYRYIKNNHPDINICFALRSSSHDWNRLEDEGFNLVDFGSKECDEAFKNASKIVSSHVDYYITHYLGKNTLKDKDFVFLQHGTIKHDLSTWLNSKNIKCFITTTPDEYASIVASNNYKFSNKEVVMTGQPRHDSLIKNNKENTKQILIMPTWRHYIVGETIKDNANSREFNPKFLNTDYAKYWLSFLKSEELKNLINQYNYTIIFNPHSNIKPYLSLMNLPDYIEVKSTKDGFQKLFQNSKFMITDYSSVDFEMALLNKTVLYYQFDENQFFGGEHTLNKGYFDYRKDGFGPVATKEMDLLKQLEVILKNEGKPLPKYQEKINNTFKFKDTNNSKRVYEAIIALDELKLT